MSAFEIFLNDIFMLKKQGKNWTILMFSRYRAFEMQFHLIVVFSHFLKLVSKIMRISLGNVHTITNSFLC